MSEDTIKRSVFSEQIKDSLIKGIIYGTYKPGDRLVESALAKKFGASQAPVREALKALAEMGFVTLVPYKGTIVRKMTKHEIWETVSVRSVLESFAAGLCAKVITDKQIEKLEQIAECMIKAAEVGDIEKRIDCNNEFHDEIINISGHELVKKLATNLRFASWSYTTGTYTMMNQLAIAQRHAQIIDCMKAHDSQAAENVMREHITDTLESFLENYKDDEENKS